MTAIRSFYFAMILIFSGGTFADELDYRWLEILSYRQGESVPYPNSKQQEWLDKQSLKRDEYISTLGASYVDDFLAPYRNKEKILKSFFLKDGRILRYILSKGATSHSVYIEDKEGNRETLLSTHGDNDLYSFGLYQNYSIRGFELGPNENYLFILTPERRTTTTNDMVIYDLRDLKKETHIIKNSYSNAVRWDTNDSFYYGVASAPGMSFKLDLITGVHQYFPTKYERLYNPIGRGKVQYSLSVRYEGSDNSRISNLRIRKLGSDIYSEADMTEYFGEDSSYPRFNSGYDLGKSFAFSEGDNRLVFIPYRFDEVSGKFHFKKYLSHETPKRGSFQNIRSNDGFIFAEYLSGPFKYYKVYNSVGEEVVSLNAPKAATMISFKHISDLTFKFSFTSNVVPRKSFEYSVGQKMAWNPREIDEAMLTDKDGVHYKNVFIFATSKDGQKVPMRVVYRSDIEPSAETPLYINAYGGHGMVTSFRARYVDGIHEVVKRKGVFAALGVRGGGEYGNEWYEAVFGTLKRFEDTEVLIEKLHDENLGSPKTTAFEGWSNGGLLAGVIVTRRPDLFKIVVSGNGLHDMERKEIFESPYFWAREFGDAMTREGVEFLRSYSPLRNAMRFREYPTVYIIAGATDKRVNPSHSMKMAAVLQDYQRGDSPIILDFVDDVGHWPVTPAFALEEGLKTATRKWKAVFHEIGLK